MGESFTSAFKGLASFIRQEQGSSSTDLTIISHGGMRGDSPILLTNCMNNDIEYNFLRECIFIDSVKAFKNSGYHKPGLDTLCRINNITNITRYSAPDDASILKQLCETHQFIFEDCLKSTFTDVLEHVFWRLPMPIATLRITAEYISVRQLVNILRRFMREGTTLNSMQIRRIALYYRRSSRNMGSTIVERGTTSTSESCITTMAIRQYALPITRFHILPSFVVHDVPTQIFVAPRLLPFTTIGLRNILPKLA